METQLTTIKPIFTFLLGLVTDVLAVIIANPIMLIPIGAGLVFTGIGIFRALR